MSKDLWEQLGGWEREWKRALWQDYESRAQALWDEHRDKARALLDEYESRTQALWQEYKNWEQALLDEYERRTQALRHPCSLCGRPTEFEVGGLEVADYLCGDCEGTDEARNA